MTSISIKYNEIPTYLQAGAFYRSLNFDEPESSIEIPAENFEYDETKASTKEEYWQLLRVMAFWSLDQIPIGIVQFCDQNDCTVWMSAFEDIPGAMELNILPALFVAHVFRSDPRHVTLKYVCEQKRWNVTACAVRRMDRSGPGSSLVAEIGDLRLLEFVHAEGFDWHKDTCAKASANGHLACLRFAHEHRCPWNRDVYEAAAHNGHLQCMKYAHEQGLEWDTTVTATAAYRGHLDCLKYAHENGCPWESKIYLFAAQEGFLSCMQYIFEQGLEWHPDTCTSAARCGHLPCLQYAWVNHCPWDVNVYLAAAKNGHVQCMQFAFQHSLAWEAEVCRVAAFYGQLACLQCAHSNGCPWLSIAVTGAAQEGQLQCLAYLLENDCPVNGDATAAASKGGHLACLQCLHQFGAPWNEVTSFHAVKCSNADCLQYLHENGCPWDVRTTSESVKNGNVHSLRYALLHGCPYNTDIIPGAARGDSVECLQCLLEEFLMCMDEFAFMTALLRGNLSCFLYLLDQGCSFFDAVFSGEETMHTYYDEIFRPNNSEFVLCVMLAVERGWTLDEEFMKYAAARDQACREWLISEGHIKPIVLTCIRNFIFGLLWDRTTTESARYFISTDTTTTDNVEYC